MREAAKVLLEYEVASRKHRKQQVDWGPWNESRRLDFINTSRRVLGRSGAPLLASGMEAVKE